MKIGVDFFVGCILFLAVSAWAHAAQSSGENSLVNRCECLNKRCGCCERIDWSWAKIDGTLCSNFTYLQEDYGISVTITYNTYTIFNETLSARNPPPICIGIPELEKIHADACIRFYNLSFADRRFHGCAKASISIYHMIHKSVNLGCWDIPDEMLSVVYVNQHSHVLQTIKKEWEELMHLTNEIPSVHMI